jgi:hypothetical protein
MPPSFYMALYIPRQAVNDTENACNSQKQKLPPILMIMHNDELNLNDTDIAMTENLI